MNDELSRIWNLYGTGGLGAAVRAAPVTPDGRLYLALLAFAEERYAEAAELAAGAARAEPEALLPRAAATYLARVAREGKRDVYVSAEGFGAFIRGGGNVPLYQATSTALAQHHPQTSFALLDIGVGDGLALLPSLTSRVGGVTLVEPSVPLLARTTEALAQKRIGFDAYAGSLQEFAAEPRSRSRHWDVAQATFSLQSLVPADRPAMLRWLRARCDVLLIAEFDPPRMDEPLRPETAAHVFNRYREGLAEYVGAEFETVAQGFLMPVMFGYADRSVARTNFEQPLAQWERLLREAGFEKVERQLLYPYWWAPAWLLVASPASPAGAQRVLE
ncbi:class I SAM-dependent methyltransferase [Melittangium boletus]|uniref:class I SAM-dependent methyltransferase n=1 Tax=Melittangium boletus TaxID=83453 RepID=UPI003DA27552